MADGLACGGIVESKTYRIGEMVSDYIVPRAAVHHFLVMPASTSDADLAKAKLAVMHHVRVIRNKDLKR